MRVLVFLAIMSTPVVAQDRDGNDTPGEWVITAQKAYGLWESFCDQRMTGDVAEERCYLRYVDVFSGHPDFAAQYMFVTPDEIEFGIEPGTAFAPDGFRITKSSDVTWINERSDCLTGKACTYTGAAAAGLLETMVDGEAFVFEFNDRHGVDQVLTWDLTAFEDALKNYRANALSKGLL